MNWLFGWHQGQSGNIPSLILAAIPQNKYAIELKDKYDEALGESLDGISDASSTDLKVYFIIFKIFLNFDELIFLSVYSRCRSARLSLVPLSPPLKSSKI